MIKFKRVVEESLPAPNTMSLVWYGVEGNFPSVGTEITLFDHKYMVIEIQWDSVITLTSTIKLRRIS